MHWLIEFFGEIGPVPKAEEVYRFSHEHFLLATIIAFIFVCLVITVLSSSILEAFHSVSRVRLTPIVALLFVVSGTLAVCAAIACVYLLRNSLEPVPILDAGQREFVREPVVLTWTQKPLPEDEDLAGPVVFRIQRAHDVNFTQQVVERPKTDGTTLYDFEEGVHWWRVQPEKNGLPLTQGWSKPARTTFYRNAFSRIQKTGRLRVFVSNSMNQGIFKFLDSGGLSGADIRLAERIARVLATELRIDVQAPVPTPIAWGELLKQPSKGTADLIVSSISRSDERENSFGLKFSIPYFCTGQSILFPKGRAPMGSITDFLRGKNVGYQEETTSERLAKAILDREGKDFFTPKSFKETAALIQALRNPNSAIQVVLTDTPFALDASLPAANLEEFDSREFSDTDYPSKLSAVQRLDRYAVGVAQGEAQLLNVINGLIANMRDRGELQKMLQEAASQKFPNLDPRQRARLYISKECPDENALN